MTDRRITATDRIASNPDFTEDSRWIFHHVAAQGVRTQMSEPLLFTPTTKNTTPGTQATVLSTATNAPSSNVLMLHPPSCNIPPTTLEGREEYAIVRDRQSCFQLLCSKEEQLLALLSLHSSSSPSDPKYHNISQATLVNSALRRMSAIPESPHAD